MIVLKYSTSSQYVVVGPFVSETDGKTLGTGLTIDDTAVKLSKNGGAFAAKSDTTDVSELSGGYYKVTLNNTDTNTAGNLFGYINHTGYLPVKFTCVVSNQLSGNIIDGSPIQTDVVSLYQSVDSAVNQRDAALTMTRFTCTVGSTTTSIVSNTVGLDSTNDHYKGMIMRFITGACAGQVTDITAYTGSTKTFTVTALTDAPQSGDTGIII